MSINLWVFSGNLGRDAQVSATPNGKIVCEFPVASSSGRGDYKKTTWVNCVILDKRAEGNLPSHLTKGQKVVITGEAYLDEWDNKKGGVSKSLKVVVADLELMGERGESQPSQQPQQSSRHNANGTEISTTAPAQGGFDDDIPFMRFGQELY